MTLTFAGETMRVLALLSLLPPLALGCSAPKGPPVGDTGLADDSGVSEGTTVEAICDAVFALCDDHWGWDDPAACYAGWLGEGAGACEDVAQYLVCVEPCLAAADCESFGACETSCWDQHCFEE